jgi:hypothetical protein
VPLITEITEQLKQQSPHGEISKEVQHRIEMECLVVDLEQLAEGIKDIQIPRFGKWFKNRLFNLREEDGDDSDRDEESTSWLTTDSTITIPSDAPLELFREHGEDEPTFDIWILIGAHDAGGVLEDYVRCRHITIQETTIAVDVKSAKSRTRAECLHFAGL